VARNYSQDGGANCAGAGEVGVDALRACPEFCLYDQDKKKERVEVPTGIRFFPTRGCPTPTMREVQGDDLLPLSWRDKPLADNIDILLREAKIAIARHFP